MPDLWIDVTSSIDWTRSPVGIIRVESEIAKNASQTTGAIRFCRYCKKSRIFTEVSRDQALRIGENSTSSSGPNAETEKSPRRNESLAYVRKKIARRFEVSRNSVLKRLPGKYREKYNLKKTRDGMNAPLLSNDILEKASEIFAVGDLYLSAGLDWDDKNQELLYSIKFLKKLKVISFCYDIIPVKFPHLCVGDVVPSFSKYFCNLAWTADIVICISESSERDFHHFTETIGSPCPETFVFRLGSDGSSQHRPSRPIEFEDASEDFILFVSTIERRKNHEVLYRAYARMIEGGRTDLPKLVFVGMHGWGVSGLMSDIDLDPRIQGKIQILDRVSDEELAWLYDNCLFTAFPSLYEGWGLPVDESLNHGKFCLAADGSSIPEAGGEFCEYLDPLNVAEWEAAIQKYLDHPEQLEARETEIAKNYRPTPWETSVASLMEEIEQNLIR